jgi:hypothetical protein
VHQGRVRALGEFVSDPSALYRRSRGTLSTTPRGRIRALGELIGDPSRRRRAPKNPLATIGATSELWRAHQRVSNPPTSPRESFNQLSVRGSPTEPFPNVHFESELSRTHW